MVRWLTRADTTRWFNVLDPIFRRGFIADSYACIPGRGTHHVVARYRAFVRTRAGRGHRLRGDVKRYFASVDHAVLLERLELRLGDRRLLDLLGTLRSGVAGASRGQPSTAEHAASLT